MVKKYKKNRNKLQELVVNYDTIIYINIQKSNIIITLTDLNGKIIDWVSSGCLGFTGFRKHSPLAARELSLALLEKTEHFNKKNFILKVKGQNAIKKILLKYISQQNLNIIKMQEISSVAFNGCKAQKRRKL